MTSILQESLVVDGDGGFVGGGVKPHAYLQKTPKVHPETGAGQGGRKRDSAKEPHKGQTAATEATTAEGPCKIRGTRRPSGINSDGTQNQSAHDGGENRKGAHSEGAYGEGAADERSRRAQQERSKRALKDNAHCSGYSYPPDVFSGTLKAL